MSALLIIWAIPNHNLVQCLKFSCTTSKLRLPPTHAPKTVLRTHRALQKIKIDENQLGALGWFHTHIPPPPPILVFLPSSAGGLRHINAFACAEVLQEEHKPYKWLHSVFPCQNATKPALLPHAMGSAQEARAGTEGRTEPSASHSKCFGPNIPCDSALTCNVGEATDSFARGTSTHLLRAGGWALPHRDCETAQQPQLRMQHTMVGSEAQIPLWKEGVFATVNVLLELTRDEVK